MALAATDFVFPARVRSVCCCCFWSTWCASTCSTAAAEAAAAAAAVNLICLSRGLYQSVREGRGDFGPTLSAFKCARRSVSQSVGRSTSEPLKTQVFLKVYENDESRPASSSRDHSAGRRRRVDSRTARRSVRRFERVRLGTEIAGLFILRRAAPMGAPPLATGALIWHSLVGVWPVVSAVVVDTSLSDVFVAATFMLVAATAAVTVATYSPSAACCLRTSVKVVSTLATTTTTYFSACDLCGSCADFFLLAFWRWRR